MVMTNTEELQKRINAAREKREALEATRAEWRAAEDLAEEANREERAVREVEALDKLEAEHGLLGKDIALIETPEGSIIVKRPVPITYRKFVDSGKSDTKAFSDLVRPCRVYPDVTEYDRLLDKYPALLASCAVAVCKLAGLRVETLAGK
jgi:hypothetical protein